MGRVFILGAGVSYTAGLPLAATLLRAVVENEFSDAETSELHEFLAYLMPTFEPDVANYPDVEEFLTLLDVAESYSCFATTGLMFPRRRLAKLRRTFLTRLSRFLWRAHEEIQDDHPIALLAKYLNPGDVVITFNYDLTLEYCLEHYADVGVSRAERSPQKVTVLKPHGSVDWFLADDVDDETDFRQLMKDLSLYSGWTYQEDVLAGKMPLIVPPVSTKLIEHRDLHQVWNTATSALANADEVYILGYSLPQADRLTRYVLRRALRKVKDNRVLLVVNPDRTMRAKFREQVHEAVRVSEQTFERWIAEVYEDRMVPEDIPFD